MAFIRIKRIRGYEYAYLVQSVWRKRQKDSRQKVKKFLGRFYRSENKRDTDFLKYYNIDSIENYVKFNTFKKIAKDLIILEFEKHDAKEFFIDFDKKVILRNNRKAVLQLNEGYLCDYTLSNLLNFKLSGNEAGLRLAKAFVEAGVQVPQELFIKIFEKLS